eukprot:8841936-Pyramimonas_sp.AAC.1
MVAAPVVHLVPEPGEAKRLANHLWQFVSSTCLSSPDFRAVAALAQRCRADAAESADRDMGGRRA